MEPSAAKTDDEIDPFSFDVGTAPAYVPTPGRDRAYTAPVSGTPILPSSLTPYASQEPRESPAIATRPEEEESATPSKISYEAQEAVNATFPTYKMMEVQAQGSEGNPFLDTPTSAEPPKVSDSKSFVTFH